MCIRLSTLPFLLRERRRGKGGGWEEERKGTKRNMRNFIYDDEIGRAYARTSLARGWKDDVDKEPKKSAPLRHTMANSLPEEAPPSPPVSLPSVCSLALIEYTYIEYLHRPKVSSLSASTPHPRLRARYDEYKKLRHRDWFSTVRARREFHIVWQLRIRNR